MTKQQPTVVRFHSLAQGMGELPSIIMAGHEWRSQSDKYDWDCRDRKDAHLAFQYTVSGEGEIEIEGRWHRLPAGSAFLIEVPGPFHYRLPAASHHWELRFVALSKSCLPWWAHLTEGLGKIVQLSSPHLVLRKLESLCDQAATGKIADRFHNSSLAYDFLMELYRLLHELPGDDALPSAVRRAIQFVEHEAQSSVGLREMAEAAGVSKFHLTRMFQDYVGDPPVQYLIKFRIRKAAALLVETGLTIDDIAKQTGFQNGNYFAKVFRKWMGMPPSAFRVDARRSGVERVQIT